MQDVVSNRSGVNVSAIHVHGIMELLLPRGRLQFQRIQVLLGPGRNACNHVRELWKVKVEEGLFLD